MEELTKTWNSLTLSKCEGSNFRIKEEEAKTEFILAAKFLTKKALNIEAIAKTFTPLWRSKNDLRIKKESDHVVLFSFDDKSEMEKVMEAEPWSFDKRLMVLQWYGREMDVGDMEFRKVTFWVQVHDLPIRFWTKKIAEQLCEAIGEVNKEIAEAESEGDNFMRVQVTIDITQPLSRGKVVLLDSGKELWVHFKYERLPSLCFWKYVVKVPGIFNAKKADAATAKSRIEKQTPMVVVRSGKLAPEIVRSENISTQPESILLEKEGFDVHKAKNKEPDLQEANIQDTRQSTMGGKKEDVTIQHAGSAKEMVLGQPFEEVLGEIDKEIGKYDSRSVGAAGFEVNMGKENLVGQPNIKEAMLPCTPSRLAHLSFSPRVPVAKIPNSFVSHGSVEGTWKRITKIGLAADASETWADEARLDRTLSKINFDQKWVVPRQNRGGGLVLFWKNSINVDVIDSYRGGKDLFLGKKVPWQLLVLIKDHKRMEVRECYWCINVVHGRVTATDMDLATLWSLWSEKVEVHILGL
uniref:DUF4283 domain-containing protein n=1 Tax=Quercus lobata TaxID=97700 RepID=A0A7N2MGE8_QUELO